MYTPGDPRHEQWFRDFPKHRRWLEEEKGIVAMRQDPNIIANFLAADAQPTLSTTPNSGIPAFMTYYVDPDIYKILFSPLEAATIAGEERKVGDWLTTTSLFPLVEWTGEVSSYGDYNANGMANTNAVWPERQSYHYQSMLEYGEREVEMASLGKINLVAEKKESSTWLLNEFQNNSYFFGVSGLQNYGMLNDPSLPAAIQPGPKAYNSQAHGPWITSGVITATPNEIYTDVQSMFIQLVAQTGGIVTINNRTRLVVAMHPTSMTALTQANIYGVTAEKLLKENYPEIRFEAAVQYGTPLGTSPTTFNVQMVAEVVRGQRTQFTGFTEKLRAHRIVMQTSSWHQKVSQGTWGDIIRFPAGFVTMTGV